MFIILHIFILCYVVSVSSGQVVSIVTSPVNLAMPKGDDAEFECKVQQPLTSDYLSWAECITNSDPCIRINNDDTMIYVDLGGDPIRGDRYSISVPAGSIGQYNLRITGTVYEEDSGTYFCGAKNAPLQRSGQLILLDGELSPTSCTRNTTSADYAQEGDIIRMVCEQPYRGRWAPVMIFDQNGPIIEARTNESSPGIAKYSITITMTPELNGEKYGVRLFFEAPTDTGEDEATNAPTYWKRFEFNPLNVEYKPRNIDITVEDGCLIAGMRITCNAEGNPNPAYEWRDTNTSEIISTAKVLTVTVEMLGQNTYSCRAYNDLGSVQETVSFQVCRETRAKWATQAKRASHVNCLLFSTTTTATTPIPATSTTSSATTSIYSTVGTTRCPHTKEHCEVQSRPLLISTAIFAVLSGLLAVAVVFMALKLRTLQKRNTGTPPESSPQYVNVAGPQRTTYQPEKDHKQAAHSDTEQHGGQYESLGDDVINREQRVTGPYEDLNMLQSIS